MATHTTVRPAPTRTAPTGRARSSNRPTGRSIIASNRKARHDYSIIDTYEAGISLTGTEVKSLRAGRASLIDGYATITEDEVWLRGVHIAEYAEGTWTNHAPRRSRKLLLHRAEIEKLTAKMRENGTALVPLSMYFLGGRVKVELGLATGKRQYDKRQTLAKRDADRELERYAGRRFKGMTG
ncbi:SsrA-binding protein SmpB [Nakamurella flavida]|uniref:SsrA-binding protein n=1 Tax=Nakamurella flavida TaxID=363630 RepID=A0A938YPN6_9ACTN|nr:SsrA-binding protein SmpB [Nakamurella flavida]MBM9477192.1 SsrA-binding protein SmpB [Nakamurella flavida]MDP9780141.1 SsrA-binding protein [Nakamurella flavida]